MGILDDDQTRGRNNCLQEVFDGIEGAGFAEGRVELVCGCGRRNLGIEGHGQQREPIGEFRCPLSYQLLEGRSRLVLNLNETAKDHPQGCIRRGRLILNADRAVQGYSVGLGPGGHLFGESGLTDSRLANDLDKLTFALQEIGDGRRRSRQFFFSPDEGQLMLDGPLSRSGWLSELHCLDRVAFPLTRNGSTGVVSKTVVQYSRTSGVTRIWFFPACDMTRAARFTASPMMVKARRNGAPTSAAKRLPRLTPIFKGSD